MGQRSPDSPALRGPLDRDRGELVARTAPAAFRQAARFSLGRARDFDAFRDAALDGLIRAARRFGHEPLEEFGPIAAVFVRRAMLDAARGLYAEGRRPIRSAWPLDASPEPAAREAARTLPPIEWLAGNLPGREREAVLLFYRDGLDTDAIGRRWGMSRKTAQRAIRRGLEILAGQIDPATIG